MEKGTSGEFQSHLDDGIKEFSCISLEVSFYLFNCFPLFKNNLGSIQPRNIKIRWRENLGSWRQIKGFFFTHLQAVKCPFKKMRYNWHVTLH